MTLPCPVDRQFKLVIGFRIAQVDQCESVEILSGWQSSSSVRQLFVEKLTERLSSITRIIEWIAFVEGSLDSAV